MKVEDAKFYMKQCEESGLWVRYGGGSYWCYVDGVCCS